MTDRAAAAAGGTTRSALLRWRQVVMLLRRSAALVFGAAPWISGAYAGLVVATNLLAVLQVWLTRQLVNALVAAHNTAIAADSARLLAVAFGATLVLGSLLWPVRVILMANARDRATAAMDRELLDAGSRLTDLVRIERPAYHDELHLVHEAAFRIPGVFQGIQWVLGESVTLTGLLILLGRLNVLLPVVLTVVSVPRLIAFWRLNRLRWQAMAEHVREARAMDYYVSLGTEPGAAKEIRVFGLSGFIVQRFRESRRLALRQVDRLRLRELRLFGLFGGLHAAVLAGGLWYVATEAGADRLSLGDIALYLGAVVQLEGRLAALANWSGILRETLLRLRDLFAFADAAHPYVALPPGDAATIAPSSGPATVAGTERLQEGDAATSVPGNVSVYAATVEAPALERGVAALDVLRTGVTLLEVGFAYPESDRPVLRSVSARLPAGQVTALVGTNGAGKSTLVKLLTRMYDPTAGVILLDGQPLSAYSLEVLRRRIAVVYQDFARFSLTLRDNINVGVADPDRAGPQLEQAATWAGVDIVAKKLAQGYDTELTRRFEGGVDLSGGEWQKVALARAFVRNAALIILDEPTAALDAEAEYQLFVQFRRLVAGKTALVISHRFSTVRIADQILVLENGAIVESGSHAELLTRGGRYSALFELQAGRYR